MPLIAAAIVIGGYDILRSKGEVHINNVDFQNSVISQSVFNAYSDCKADIDVDQYITIQCNATSGTNKPFAENLGCLACTAAQNKYVQNMNKFQNEWAALNPDNPTISFDTLPESTKDLWWAGEGGVTPGEGNGSRNQNNISFGGLCQIPCQDCIVGNINQAAKITFTESCSSSSDFATSLKSQVYASINSFMKNKDDVFGSLTSIFSSDIEKTSNAYSDHVVNKYMTDLKTIVESEMKVTQSIKIGNPDGANQSYYINNISQTMTANGVLNSISKNNFVNSLTTQQQIDETLKQYHKNDTTGDIAGDISKTITGLADIFGSVVGKVIIIIATLLVGIIAIVAAIAAFKPKFAKKMLDVGLKRYGLNSE